MRRVVTFFLTAFAFSLGLTAGSVAMRPIAEPGSAEPIAADSDQSVSGDAESGSDTEGTGSTADPESPGETRSTASAVGEVSTGDALVDAGLARRLTSQGDTPPYGAAEGDASGALQRLARVYARMNPRAAAPILSNLSDTEIQLILMDLPDRTVAEIMSSLEPERAARLTRLLIRMREVGSE